jgi:hypothetical protein
MIAPALAIAPSRAQTCFLRGGVLEHGLDQEIAFGQHAVGSRAAEQAHPLVELGLGELALGDARRVVRAHPVEAARERLVAGLDQDGRQAGVGEVHRDAAAHRSRADDADPANAAQRGVGCEPRDLGSRSLGEEEMAQSARRRRTPQCLELVGLAPLAFAKGQLDRGAHAANDRGACRIGGSLLAVRQGRGEQSFGYRWHGERAGAPGLRLRRDERSRGGDSCGEHVALGDLVDQARFERLLRADRSAGQHQIERRRHADQPRQPLRSERARQQAEMDFRKPHSRARMRDPAMTRQGKLQAAAERRAVERRHHAA